MSTDPLAAAEQALAHAERPICGERNPFTGLPCVDKPGHAPGHVFVTHDTRVKAEHLRTALTEARRLAAEVEALRAERYDAHARGYREGVADAVTACHRAADVYRAQHGGGGDFCAGVEAVRAEVKRLTDSTP